MVLSPCKPWSPPQAHPGTHPAQQGLEDAVLPGSFPDQASPTYFWEAGRILPGRSGSWQGRPVPARARLSRTRTHSPMLPTALSLRAGACLPLALAPTGELAPLWVCRAVQEPLAEPGRC